MMRQPFDSLSRRPMPAWLPKLAIGFFVILVLSGVLATTNVGAGEPTPSQYPWLDAAGHHRGFKVNLQARLLRTAIGFDTTDNALDVVMGTDLAWQWKDVEQVATRVAVGLTFPEEAAAFRAEGERLIADIERRAYPFDQPWHEWRPDPAWTAPRLPEGWADLDGANHDLNRERQPD